MKALICEDNDLTRNFLETALKKHLKFDVVSCSNGLEGIKMLGRSTFDLIISDYDMKTHQGNGIDLFYYALNNHPKTPFYLISGSDVILPPFKDHSHFKFFHKLAIVELMRELEGLR